MRRQIGFGVAGGFGLLALGRLTARSWPLPGNYLLHSDGYLGSPGVVWINAPADALIAACYAVLFGCLFWLAGKSRQVAELRPYRWIFIGFALFVFASGFTHAMESVTVWWPYYPLSSAAKVACAALSVPTAVLFVGAMPGLAGNIKHFLSFLSCAQRITKDEVVDYRGQIEAINRSQMAIEFHMDGTIIKANANYLRAFGYQDDDLTGKHHSLFVTEEFKRSTEYKQFWEELRAGRYQAGQFSRLDKDSNEIWIEASYSPILAPDGTSIKIVKFASNATDKVRSKRLRELMDGTITVESELGKGNTFHVIAGFGIAKDVSTSSSAARLIAQQEKSILIADANEQRMDSMTGAFASGPESPTPLFGDSLTALRSPLAGRRVLLVEDNEVNRLLAAELLEDLGIDVTLAHNGREGIDRVQAQAFDLVLMDIQMPIMDGLTATKLIREDSRFHSLPIVAMTAHAMSGDRERSLSSRMNDHLNKPISPTVLTEMLVRWMPARSITQSSQSTIDTVNSLATSSASYMPELLPPFDLPAALARANGKPELLRKMLLSFRDRYRSAATDLRLRIAEGRAEDVRRMAHSLQGVAAALEAWDLADAAATIERAISEGSMQGLDALVANMETALDPAIAAADSVERRLATSAPGHAIEPVSLFSQPDMCILLVDDQSSYLDLLKDVFGSRTEVLYASDGEAALRIATAKVPDLILLDVMMAGIDGYEVFERLRTNSSTSNIPVIFLSGLGSVADETKGLTMGACDYVTKPIHPETVRTRVTHQIELRRAQQELKRLTAEEHSAQLAKEESRAAEVIKLSQQTLQLRDDFLSHVSHEFRSPLTSIYSFSTIIADGLAGRTTHQQDEYLKIIQKNVRQLQSMIEDLLAVTASRTGKLGIQFRDTPLSEAILDAVHTCEANARQKGVKLCCVLPPQLPSAYGDPVRLLQVLIILCDNAIKFTPAGGSVKVQAGTFEKVPGYLLVEVSDTGCGIKPELLEKIFEHLYQVTGPSQGGRQGLGLGLHIAKELMTRQGGSLWATSAQGSGSVFSFTVPIFAGQRLEEPVLS